MALRVHRVVVALTRGIALRGEKPAVVEEVQAAGMGLCEVVHGLLVDALVVHLDAVCVVEGDVGEAGRHDFDIDAAVANAQSGQRESRGICVGVAVVGHQFILREEVRQEPRLPEAAVL